MAAASQMRESVRDSTRVRIDPDARSPEQTALIAALRRYERARSALKGPDLSPLASEIGRRLDPAARGASRRGMLFTFSGRKKQEARDAPKELPGDAAPVNPDRADRIEHQLRHLRPFAAQDQVADHRYGDHLRRALQQLDERAEIDHAHQPGERVEARHVGRQAFPRPVEAGLQQHLHLLLTVQVIEVIRTDFRTER